jgi:hypothetical protein
MIYISILSLGVKYVEISEISGEFQGNFRNFRGISGEFQGNFRNFRGISEISGKGGGQKSSIFPHSENVIK